MKPLARKTTLMFAGLMVVLAVAACSTAPDTETGKTNLQRTSADALNQAEQSDASLATLIQSSTGYAVFPDVGKGAVGVGGAYGKGDVYQNGVVIGFCDMTQGSVGVQLGGQAYTEILVFQSQDALDNFKSGNLTFDAQASAVAVKSGAAANAKFANGVAVFTMDLSGLMYEASIGGQKFSYQAK